MDHLNSQPLLKDGSDRDVSPSYAEQPFHDELMQIFAAYGSPEICNAVEFATNAVTLITSTTRVALREMILELALGDPCSMMIQISVKEDRAESGRLGAQMLMREDSEVKHVHINAYPNGWAESIIWPKHKILLKQGEDSWFFWGRESTGLDNRAIRFNNNLDVYVDALITRLDGKTGFHSKRATKRLIKMLDEIKPDAVYLHVLTGYYLNIDILFYWLLNNECKVIWTLHDCWAFTGHCIHFTEVGCSDWEKGCGMNRRCPQIHSYPETVCRSSVWWNYSNKKKLFTMIPRERVTIVTPSKWLAELVKRSYLGIYPVEVVPNKIDTTTFKKRNSDFRERYNLENKFIILGVASKWSESKGLLDFVNLAEIIDDRFTIVLIGLSKKQISELKISSKANLIPMERTRSKEELAEIYSTADIFFNPTHEDNYPTVNLEAEACGTPVYTYDTGGCKETIGKNADSCLVKDYVSLYETLCTKIQVK